MKTEQKELDFIKVDTQSFIEMCEKIETLEKTIEEITEENTYFKARNLALATRCRDLAQENHDLAVEIKDMKFTHKMLNSEEAGRAFARELLGKPMTREELAISAAENAYEPYSGDDF